MAFRKDNFGLAAGAVEQVGCCFPSREESPLTLTSQIQSSLLTKLPAELFDGILERLLVFRSPIEFSPIEYSLENMESYKMDVCQFGHAVDYRTHIRPALAALRVCKAFFALGVQKYYSLNKFRFSSVYGWAVLARFFDLIGPATLASSGT